MKVQPILLTGYDAKRCTRRIHNEWDPSIEQVEWVVPPELQARFDLGITFESDVFAELAASLGSSRLVDLSGVRGKTAVIAATVKAMDDGIDVILGGWLPDDNDGARTGKPDVLLRLPAGGYVPGDVKAHQATAARAKGALRYSGLGEPATVLEAGGRAAQTTSRLDDYLQLAHYWRMLEAAGRAANVAPTGFIIGTDDLPDLTSGGRILTWVELDVPLFETFSRQQGKAKRSALERYDHEQQFRLKVARTAIAGEPALVQPIFTSECDYCPWYEYCRDLADDDVASAQITSGRLSVREWRALGTAGVSSVEELAGLDTSDSAFRASYLPEVTHRKNAMDRLDDAVRRARMIRRGVSIERSTTGPIVIPRADIEVDFDIEWDANSRVYLYGALVSRHGEAATYRPTVSWDVLDDGAEVVLAGQFADWLRGLITDCAVAGHSVLIYHYSHPETNHLKRLLGEDAVADLMDHFVDLLPIVRANYFGLDGLGLKKVAESFGFSWRDESPGGLQSQLWLEEARSADELGRRAARDRVLAYNEDDVTATKVISQRPLLIGRGPPANAMAGEARGRLESPCQGRPSTPTCTRPP